MALSFAWPQTCQQNMNVQHPARKGSQTTSSRPMRPPPWVEASESVDLLDIRFLDEDTVGLLPDVQSLTDNTDLTDQMRSKVVSWLIDIRDDLAFHDATLHLAVFLSDRALSAIDVCAKNYQLVALACVWIAVKYEEEAHKVPKLPNLCTLAMNMWSPAVLLQIEREILHALRFNISIRTAHWFLAVGGFKTLSGWTRGSMETPEARRKKLRKIMKVAFEHLEASLHHSEFLGVPPSWMAEAALLTACRTLTHPSLNVRPSLREVGDVVKLLDHFVNPPVAIDTMHTTPIRGMSGIQTPLTPITPSNTENPSSVLQSATPFSMAVVKNWYPSPASDSGDGEIPNSRPISRQDDEDPDDPMQISSSQGISTRNNN
ncbi:hypothetical protein HDU93_000507 [Gonapodya sp. JEL0774]|nr:hypothetical protein HDU93_000507 [Gonapodya sp. JEL0774]